MVRDGFNTAHKSRLAIQPNGSLLLYALIKGENWMKLVFSMIKNRKKWFESNTQLLVTLQVYTILGSIFLSFSRVYLVIYTTRVGQASISMEK